MTHSTFGDDPQLPRLSAPSKPNIDLVCGHCGHAFRTPMSALADAAEALRCPACRKTFKMSLRFAHDAIDELDKRRRTDPVDQVLADLGRVLRG